MNLSAIIVAAGSGQRMGGSLKKQYQLLNGKPIFVHSLHIFYSMPGFHDVILVIPPGDKAKVERYLLDYAPLKEVKLAEGGVTRQQSVAKGLLLLNKKSDIVCIHDAVRPFATTALLKILVESACQYGAAIPVLPLTDTIKIVSSAGYVEDTPPRDKLYAVQTPQAFQTTLLVEAYENAVEKGYEFTDDAAIVEKYGFSVFTVPGEAENIKITNPYDLTFALSLFKERS